MKVAKNIWYEAKSFDGTMVLTEQNKFSIETVKQSIDRVNAKREIPLKYMICKVEHIRWTDYKGNYRNIIKQESIGTYPDGATPYIYEIGSQDLAKGYKPTCKICEMYNGSCCMKEWNNLDESYFIPERDNKDPDDCCDDFKWDGEMPEGEPEW